MEAKFHMSDDEMFVKTFTDTGYKVTVETDGMSIFGTPEGKDLLKNLQNELANEIDKEILKKLKEGF
jgi:uncharacterized protein YfeS